MPEHRRLSRVLRRVTNGICRKLGLNALRESWLPSFSSLPLAGEITEGEAGRKDFFKGLLGMKPLAFSRTSPQRQAPGASWPPGTAVLSIRSHALRALRAARITAGNQMSGAV